MRKICILFVLLLAACRSGNNNYDEVWYQCTNEESSIPVRLRFFEGGADIVINNRSRHRMEQTEVASGARYASDDGIEFWTKGREATLTTFGASVECVER